MNEKLNSKIDTIVNAVCLCTLKTAAVLFGILGVLLFAVGCATGDLFQVVGSVPFCLLAWGVWSITR